MVNIDGGMNKTAFVIFGVTGDLTKRKLLPALYQIIKDKRFALPLYIIGFARRDWDNQYIKNYFSECIREQIDEKIIDKSALNSILNNLFYIQSPFTDLAGFLNLERLLDKLEITNRIFYLACPPEYYSEIIHQLGQANLSKNKVGFSRIIVEKPYGIDLASAKDLDEQIHKVFDEKQVYRIDHYLGKETVQNILVFRFANGIFEPLWNRSYVDHIQISVAEKVGIAARANYYEKAGVIRDMFQNHILQLLALTTMEAPFAFKPDAVRDEKLKILRSLRPMNETLVDENTFRAQYGPGLIDGETVLGYKEEPGVAADSKTETYLATRLFIDNWRWAGVPIYVRSGKRLKRVATEIAVQFKQVPLKLFDWQNFAGDAPNILVLNVQPDEGITLTFGARSPGLMNKIEPVKMSFDYVHTFGIEPIDAYERLLVDALTGDATLFNRTDEVQAAWEFTDKITYAWKSQPILDLPQYPAGAWGPKGADEFIQRDGRNWIYLS